MYNKSIKYLYSIIIAGASFLALPQAYAEDQATEIKQAMEQEIQKEFSDPFFSNLHEPEKSSIHHFNIKFPKIRLLRQSNRDIIQFITPGMPKKDINIDISGNTMTVSGKSKFDILENPVKELLMTESFKQQIEIPQDVEAGKITSDYKEGLLTIIFPKKTSEVQNIKKTIQIN